MAVNATYDNQVMSTHLMLKYTGKCHLYTTFISAAVRNQV